MPLCQQEACHIDSQETGATRNQVTLDSCQRRRLNPRLHFCPYCHLRLNLLAPNFTLILACTRRSSTQDYAEPLCFSRHLDKRVWVDSKANSSGISSALNQAASHASSSQASSGGSSLIAVAPNASTIPLLKTPGPA